MSNNGAGTDNQQGTSIFDRGHLRDYTPIPNKKEIQSYFQGAIHDGTYNVYNRRVRICQKEKEWLILLQYFLQTIGIRSWIYREGKYRNLYVLETVGKFFSFSFNPLELKTRKEKAAYLRGFFDAEGGIPQKFKSRFYIQLVQKDRVKIQKIKILLHALKIKTGLIHNPSKKVDPHYWRTFVSSKSYQTFIRVIGSWHPRKRKILDQRWVMI